MKIDDISSPELHDDLQTQLCSQIESSIKDIEKYAPGTALPDSFSTHLRRTISQLNSLSPFSNSLKLHIWKLSYRLWNACVDLSNANANAAGLKKHHEEHAKLRQVSADLLFLAADVSGIPSPAFKCASFFYKTGLIWHDLRKFELANYCFEKASDLLSKVDITNVSEYEEKKLLLDLNIARSRTAWEVSDRNLAIALLSRSKNVLFAFAENYKALANQYLMFGKAMLSKNEVSGVNEALKLMNDALELCERGLTVVKRTAETLTLKELRSKTLRFLGASHLQRDEFESVLKCVKVLRDGDKDQHPSLSVLAMKAWLGLGRFGEAEKELRRMVVDKGIPEGVWVSAVESYFQVVGAAGAPVVKGVFLGLLGRCHVSADAAIRVVNKVIGDPAGGGEEARLRAKVVSDLVSDDRILTLLNGHNASKERTAMHAFLWNCAAEHFRSKDLQTSADIFEKSMLYVPSDIESRNLRAKGFRVLCLCYMGLSQLDRAQEYINEAEKYKIYLQKKELNGAITQVQALPSCLDFTTEFLSLAAHEAIACRCLPVAVASLSLLLNFYSTGKQMPTTEVVVFRTLVTILSQDSQNDSDILKQMKRAHSRLREMSAENFFGKGEIGRRERNWFSVNAWNSGVKTGQENQYAICAEFFRLASEFYGASIDEEKEGNHVMVCKSLIMTVSAIISDEKLRTNTLLENEVKEAISLLDRAGKMLMSSSTEYDKLEAIIEPNFLFVYTWCAFDLHSRLDNTGSQQFLLIKRFANSKCCNPSHLLQIGINASQGPSSNHEVAIFALSTCLSTFLALPLPDYASVAQIVRKLVSLRSIHGTDTNDDAKMETYKQAYRIMVGLKEGEYPVEEAKWLAMTAWNRAAVPVRMGHMDEAKRWMSMGLELAKKVPGMQTYRSCMEDFIAGFEKKLSGA
ncbi:TPR repeat-containing protein ZIP4 isoform X2 [Solanum dulcamara]|uniref:TPR repeat-containing protein ZIP4 isoform X2 n=1 Tax=Solanum dulcamara TaxID=45834 RepID=UPI002484F27C|nr:TPR repeat-containing protein ZIP4 isoform X2 [Solanum dulcamara]